MGEQWRGQKTLALAPASFGSADSCAYEECFEGLILALELAEKQGRPLTQDQYQRLANDRPEIPAYATLERYAGMEGMTFAEMRSKAIEERDRRRP